MANLNPRVLEWAVRRCGWSDEEITRAFPKYPSWLDGSWRPTVRQLRDFARKTHVSVSELFADDLPDYALQITDFRTVDNVLAREPSPELFDTIDEMLARQSWMRGYFLHEGYVPIHYVGSYADADLTEATNTRIVDDLHALLKLDETWAAACKNVTEALRVLKDSVEASGIAVMINGVVNDNTHRVLDVSEFRGFALADRIAPIVFINGRDVKSAQIFTLIHELCHLALFQTGVSNAADDEETDIAVERFCNSVAASFLVPESVLTARWEDDELSSYAKLQEITRLCKVNFAVVARKARESGLISDRMYHEFYEHYLEQRPTRLPSAKSGGNYYSNKQYKLGIVFSDAVNSAVHSGYLSYRDAYDLAGMSAPSFKKYFEEVA